MFVVGPLVGAILSVPAYFAVSQVGGREGWARREPLRALVTARVLARLLASLPACAWALSPPFNHHALLAPLLHSRGRPRL